MLWAWIHKPRPRLGPQSEIPDDTDANALVDRLLHIGFAGGLFQRAEQTQTRSIATGQR